MIISKKQDKIAKEKALNTDGWSFDEVLDHTIEEMAELTFALTKFRRRSSKGKTHLSDKYLNNIAEEVGHVLCQCHILSHMFHPEVVEKEFKRKLGK